MFSLAAVLCLIAGLILLSPAPVTASSPQPQAVYATPTAGADGRIIYIVKEGDTCSLIYLFTHVTVNELKSLNRLDDACTVAPGQKLLLGTAVVPTNTPGPAPTATPSTPTATPFNGSGQICVFLFEDKNGNGMPDNDEAQIAGGAVSVSDRIGKYSKTSNTKASSDPLCFTDLSEGDYNVSVAPPEGFNATTSMNFPVKIQPGDTQNINFGAQISIAKGPGPGGTNDPKTPLLAIFGGLLIVGGLGLGFYFWRLKMTNPGPQ
jgi:LysM repeat protein